MREGRTFFLLTEQLSIRFEMSEMSLTAATKHPEKAVDEAKREHTEEYEIISGMVVELAMLLDQKIQLQDENAKLKLQFMDLSQKLDTYNSEHQDEMLYMKKEREERELCHLNELTVLRNQHAKCKELYDVQVNNFEMIHNNHKEQGDKREQVLKNKIESLEDQLEAFSTKYDNLKEYCEIVHGKYSKYKAKLKYAIEILKQLDVKLENGAGNHVGRIDIFNSGFENVLKSQPRQTNEVSEALSDLFLKTNPFYEGLDVFFLKRTNAYSDDS